MQSQWDIELGLNRYSPSFGSDLLPGMVLQPCFPVLKPGTVKFRLINDHTVGHFACNFILLCMVWKKHDIWWNWVPHERSIILLEGGLYHLSTCKKFDIWWIESLMGEVLSHKKEIYSIYPPTKNMTFIGLSPSWEKYYPTWGKLYTIYTPRKHSIWQS